MSLYFSSQSLTHVKENLNYDHTFYIFEKETGSNLKLSKDDMFKAYKDAYTVIEALENRYIAQIAQTCDMEENEGMCDYQRPENLSEAAKLRVRFAENAIRLRYAPTNATNRRYEKMGLQKKPQHVKTVPSS
jgi:hypothetical protein